MKNTNYQKEKDAVRNQAIKIQMMISERNLSYQQIINIQHKLYKKAKKYGLVRELKENGLI